MIRVEGSRDVWSVASTTLHEMQHFYSSRISLCLLHFLSIILCVQAEFLFITDKIRLNDKIIMDILSDGNVILKSKFKWYGDSGFRENRQHN